MMIEDDPNLTPRYQSDMAGREFVRLIKEGLAKMATEPPKDFQVFDKELAPPGATVDSRQPFPDPSRSERLRTALSLVAACLSSEGVTIETSMPFDYRQGIVGLALTPAILNELIKLYPDVPTPMSAAQLVARLMTELAAP